MHMLSQQISPWTIYDQKSELTSKIICKKQSNYRRQKLQNKSKLLMKIQQEQNHKQLVQVKTSNQNEKIPKIYQQNKNELKLSDNLLNQKKNDQLIQEIQIQKNKFEDYIQKLLVLRLIKQKFHQQITQINQVSMELPKFTLKQTENLSFSNKLQKFKSKFYSKTPLDFEKSQINSQNLHQKIKINKSFQQQNPILKIQFANPKKKHKSSLIFDAKQMMKQKQHNYFELFQRSHSHDKQKLNRVKLSELSEFY